MAAAELAALVPELQDLRQPPPELLEVRWELEDARAKASVHEAGKLRAQVALAELQVGGGWGGGWGWQLGAVLLLPGLPGGWPLGCGCELDMPGGSAPSRQEAMFPGSR